MGEIEGDGLTQAERETMYEAILNSVLKGDEATKTCSVVKNSFQYFEPGCCANAKVICKEEVAFDTWKDFYDGAGAPTPVFSYKVRNEQP